ncbi:hypothetical protein LYNGBM3L_13260 [Moorena producens 3L]|uniref:Uncharacterized protein n=1 Tax=Moorena producens 3L TaxID=489825 RepID=F4XL59_9CYAN|nr:hypothetical protein LYNGBM3L_13260 [Moorena producens 3L]
MGRWGDGEMGEVFIKGNYPDTELHSKIVDPEMGRWEDWGKRKLYV